MNVLTFDIEDWFHILDNESTRTEDEWNRYEKNLHNNMDRIFTFLERTGQKATFFCLGWVAKNYPNIVRQIDQMGHEIGTHSYMHQLVYDQSRKEFENDLDLSIDTISNITGKKIMSYRAPGFSITERNKWVFEVLLDRGIQVDCSIFPARRAHGGYVDFEKAEPLLIDINGRMIKEFPINVYKIGNRNIIFSGGGYFRLCPYLLIRYFMKRSNYVMTYFHPRDFSSDQPVIKELSLLRKFKSYYGLKTAFAKFERLIDDHEFIDLRTAVERFDWESAKVVAL